MCILMGVLLLAVPICYRIHGAGRTEQMLKQFEQALEDTADGGEGQGMGEDGAEAVPAQEHPVLSEADAALLAGENVIGIIEIEALDIKYPILEGAGNEQIRYAIGHIPETAGIGGMGNCVLCGHNGSRNGTFFTHLNQIKQGDVVRLTDSAGEVHLYEVSETFITGAYDNTVKDSSGEELLTLLTCANHGTQRFICRCVPERDEQNQ